MQNEKERYDWMDNLRALATSSVIILHVSYLLLGKFDTTPVTYRTWWTGNVYDSSVRFCVPVFLMLSGALLLGSDISLGYFLKRRFIRLLLPFIFWSVVYMFFSYDYKSAHTIREIIHWVYSQFANGASSHMWYVYVIIGIYLFIPIINKWIVNSTEQEILFFLSIWVFTIVTGPKQFTALNTKIDLSNFSGYLGYLVLGYYLSVKQFNKKHIMKIAAAIFLAGILFTIIATYYLTLREGDSDSFYYNYLSINVMIASVGIFLLFKNYRSAKKTILSKISKVISKYSYGVYLVHILVLGELDHLKINGFLIDPIIGVPITAAICLAISVFIIWLISKIPYGRYIAG